MNDDAPSMLNADEGDLRPPREPAASAEAAGRRFAFLAEVGRELSSSLDIREMLTRLADLLVTDFADYAIVDIFDERGETRRAAVAHRRLEGREILLELQRRYPPHLGSPTGMALVMRTGEPVLAPEVTERQLRAAAQDEEHARLLVCLGARSSILVPLVAHGRVLGAVAIALTEGERRYGPDDLALAEEIGQRAALALDNARLFQQAQDANQTLLAMVQSCPLAVMVLEPEDGTVRLWNPAAERIFGWSEGEVLGRPLPIVPADGRDEFHGNLRAVARGEPFQLGEARRLCKDGTSLDVGIWASPLPSPGGARVLALVADVTERKRILDERRRLEEELRQRVEELAAADRAKDEFLAMLAHELRNPLAAIANAGHVLDRKGAAGPGASELPAMIGRQIRHLSRLVDDLLDVSRFNRGRIELRKETIDLRRAVAGAVETARPLIEQRRHALDVALPAEPLWIEADVTRIEQVLANLLHNAAKFTEPGGAISLSVQAEGDEVLVRVRDTGTGISADLLPRVFDLFVQEERSLARSQGGLGIGLTLVRTLVERHGGTIEAVSEGPGRGSELRIRLPRLPAPRPDDARPDDAAEKPAQERPAGERPPARVLLVEDNLDAAGALVELLRMWGHPVETAHDGVAALRVARETRPEIVLLDIGLPGMDGYEVASRLRATSGFGALRLVALTGYGQEADRRRSRLAGFDHHLVKPVDLDLLRELLRGEENPGK
jgi:PAS domain S-box-containing protein